MAFFRTPNYTGETAETGKKRREVVSVKGHFGNKNTAGGSWYLSLHGIESLDEGVI